MKTIYKAIIGIVAAVLFGVYFMYAYSVYSGHDRASTVETAYQDIMLEAKHMFLEKSDPIQLATLGLINTADASILRDRDGYPCVKSNEGLISISSLVDDETEAYIIETMGEYENEGVVCNIELTSDAILFFTHYDPDGCVGFLYEKELNNTEYYSTIEIVENWKIFYIMDVS